MAKRKVTTSTRRKLRAAAKKRGRRKDGTFKRGKTKAKTRRGRRSSKR